MKRFLALCFLTFALLLVITGCTGNINSNNDANIVVASKDFTEQDILGKLLAQQIKATTNLKVARRPRLGGSFVCHNAIKSGIIDAYIEYTGTALTAILKQKPVNNSKEVYEIIKQIYAQQFNLEVMPSLGFENTFAMIIWGEDAKRNNIKTLSQATQYTPQWRGIPLMGRFLAWV